MQLEEAHGDEQASCCTEPVLQAMLTSVLSAAGAFLLTLDCGRYQTGVLDDFAALEVGLGLSLVLIRAMLYRKWPDKFSPSLCELCTVVTGALMGWGIGENAVLGDDNTLLPSNADYLQPTLGTM